MTSYPPEHVIAPGVHGWLESPASNVIASDCLAVAGWAFVQGHPIVDVWSTGFGARRPLQCGIRRDDVAAIYPGEATALQSGFTGYLELDGAPGERVNFDIWARLDDGRAIQLYQRNLLTQAPVLNRSRLRTVVDEVKRRPIMLVVPRTWISGLRLIRRTVASPPAKPIVSATGKAALRRATREALAAFLDRKARLTFTPAATPLVSVVLVVWNHADLTLTCLRALAEQSDVPMEVVIVDNASTDETPELLSRLDGVAVVKNASNHGFTVAVNIGAKAARGEFLLFLNNDAALAPGSIKQLLDTARGSTAIGAVGGKLVYTDGNLQEAGSIIWSDGRCEGYGRGGDPGAPEYNFERAVDFCSAALLLTRRTLFEQLGGLDERYRPAYYDDADYCVRVWASGHSVVYQPKASAIHYEFGSTSPETSMDLQLGRRPIFVSTHRQWLSLQKSSAEASVIEARCHPHGSPSVLVIDDAAPDPRKGAGFSRAAALLRALSELGYLVTLYTTAEHTAGPIESVAGSVPSAASAEPKLRGVEIVRGRPAGLRDFLASRGHHDLIIVSRPHNMQHVKAAVGSDLSALGSPVVYDAEAVYAVREVRRRQLLGLAMAHGDGQALIDAELGLGRGCAAVLAVNQTERELFSRARVENVHVLGHAIDPRPTGNTFEARRSILFVGAFSAHSPNEDAVRHFVRDVLPALRTSCGCDAPVVVAGADIPVDLVSGGDASISWHSGVDDLTPHYDDARIFVAPTRYSAGISLKVIEAASRGVPVVCTSLVADQLGWTSGVEVLAADGPADYARAIASIYENPALWARLREAALKRVADDCGADVFRAALVRALAAARSVSV